MHMVVRELAQKPDLQSLLCCLLQNTQKYFKSISPMSEEKTYSIINMIFYRIQQQFPLCYSISNISKRLIRNLTQKINQKTDKNSKKKSVGLKSFINRLHQDQETNEGQTVGKDNEGLFAWIRKILIEQIEALRDDVKDADLTTEEVFRLKVQRDINSSVEKPIIVFMDSFLHNSGFMKNILEYDVRKICDQNKIIKDGQIKLEDASTFIRRARYVVISADSVMKNGGILARSGSLMLAIASKAFKVPVVVVSRSFCLSENIILSQKQLIANENSLDYFDNVIETDFKVLIGKKFDYIEPKLITNLICEIKSWDKLSINEIFDDYYQI